LGKICAAGARFANAQTVSNDTHKTIGSWVVQE